MSSVPTVDRIAANRAGSRPGSGAAAPASSDASSTDVPTTADNGTWSARTARLLQSDAFHALTLRGQAYVVQILAGIPTSPRGPYLFDRLEQLLATPTRSQPERMATQRERIRSAAREQQARRAADPNAAALERREEDKAASPLRRWVLHRAAGQKAGAWIDRSNPKDLVVQVKVRLKGDAAVAADIRTLEDAIEKLLAVPGFTVDLKLVDKAGPDVFDVALDLAKPVTAHNWVGNASSLAHELLHLLGLPDEYDYVAVHATNQNVSQETRLQWFALHMNDALPADAATGIMAVLGKPPLERQVCQAVGLPITQCVRDRAGVSLRPPTTEGSVR